MFARLLILLYAIVSYAVFLFHLSTRSVSSAIIS